MKTNTSQKILDYVSSKGRVSAKEIIDYLGFSRQAVFKQLAKLLEQEKISKLGMPPKVFYVIVENRKAQKEYEILEDIKIFIEERFIDITPAGQMQKGWTAFVDWCLKRNQDVKKSAMDYVDIIKKYDAIRKNGLIDGMKKMKNTFSKVYLDSLFYLDFYSVERFGKTRLGKTLLYAKQSQNKAMIKEIAKEIKPAIQHLIRKYNVDAVAFIPPTVKREVQFIKELERNLKLSVNIIRITKIKTPIMVPQKTLSKLEDRIENAEQTFILEETTLYNNILLIDDAVGSGATLNEIAAQIKKKSLVKDKIIGLAITGSLKGFDVISEV
ncbi:hypothetical protein KAR26_02370 [Candidatus Parcubacteria bacterium]|nr:hypothetical protein [Candidatus Parcubacteria bacterium]